MASQSNGGKYKGPSLSEEGESGVECGACRQEANHNTADGRHHLTEGEDKPPAQHVQRVW